MQQGKLFSNKINVQLIAEVFLAMGVKNIVFSPGSRNGALMMHFVNHGGFNTYSVVDERSAAFVALGMSQKTGSPTVVCCTSGSAAVNYYPAVTEAFYQNIPLIVLTADRPASYTDIFDGQTIRQENVFEKHSYFNVQLSELETDERLTENFLEIKKAVQSCIVNSGPVHINMPFSEPLYESTTEKLIDIEKIGLPVEQYDTLGWDDLLERLNKKEKIFILVGLQRPSKWLNNALNEISKLPQVIVFTENTSNVHGDDFVSRIDNALFGIEGEQKEELRPDLLITLGQNIISKKVKKFLRLNKPSEHWHVNPYWHPDTYFSLSKKLNYKEELFADELSRYLKPKNADYREKWLNILQKNEKKQKEYLKELEFSDLYVFKTLVESYPNDTVIHYSNSSIIRYSQLFNHNSTVKVFCNRGTSGIDGSTSTAVGYAMKTDELVVLVTGDISFFYDSNALWNAKLPKNLRIILINNGGGDIFNIIPGPDKTEIVNEYFSTKHTLTAKPLAELYNLGYAVAKDKKELANELACFYKRSNTAKILEVDTTKIDSASIMRKYINLAKN